MSYPSIVNLIKPGTNISRLIQDIPINFDKLVQLVQKELDLQNQKFKIIQIWESNENKQYFEINNDSQYQTALCYCQNLSLENIDIEIRMDNSQNIQIWYQEIQQQHQQVRQNLRTCRCGHKFNTKDRIPMELPCSHNLCYICMNEQWLSNKQINCYLDNSSHQIDPRNFKQNDSLLAQLDFIQNKQEQIQNDIQKIQNHQFDIKQLQTSLNKKFSNFLQNLMRRAMGIIYQFEFQINKFFQKHEEENDVKLYLLQTILNLEELPEGLTINNILQHIDTSNLNEYLQQGYNIDIKTQESLFHLLTKINTVFDQFQFQEIDNSFKQEQQNQKQIIAKEQQVEYNLDQQVDFNIQNQFQSNLQNQRQQNFSVPPAQSQHDYDQTFMFKNKTLQIYQLDLENQKLQRQNISQQNIQQDLEIQQPIPMQSIKDQFYQQQNYQQLISQLDQQNLPNIQPQKHPQYQQQVQTQKLQSEQQNPQYLPITQQQYTSHQDQQIDFRKTYQFEQQIQQPQRISENQSITLAQSQQQMQKLEDLQIKEKQLNYEQDQQFYSTIVKSSKIQKTFNFGNEKFENKNIIIPATISNGGTYVEQIKDHNLLISGNDSIVNQKSFISLSQDQSLQLQMNQKRQYHRTAFDSSTGIDFIISGSKQKDCETTKCEKYDSKNNQFEIIAEIITPVSHFGCCLAQSSVITFGGDTNKSKQNAVQIYSIDNNQWIKHSKKFPERSYAAATYLKNLDACLIYHSNIDTFIFDFNNFFRHEEIFQGQYPVYTNAIMYSNTVYQFDLYSELFSYEMGKSKWEKIQ